MQIQLTRGWSLIVAAALGGTLVVGAEAVISWLRPGGVSSGVLAVVDGKPITLQAFQSEITRRGGEAAFSAPEQRRALLDDMIRVAVLAANAQKAGYADDPEVRRSFQQLLADKYQREKIDVPLADLRVSDGDLEDYYRTHAASFTTPEAVHAAVILVAVPATASEDERRVLLQRAQHIREQALAKVGGQSFAELATQYSDDRGSRRLGGDIGWLEVGQDNSHWETALTSAIFDLHGAGDVSPLITTASGIYIAKLLERKPPVVRPVSEVRDRIREQLTRVERQQRAAKLYADALAKVRVDVNEAGVAAMEATEKAVVDVPDGAAPRPKG